MDVTEILPGDAPADTGGSLTMPCCPPGRPGSETDLDSQSMAESGSWAAAAPGRKSKVAAQKACLIANIQLYRLAHIRSLWHHFTKIGKPCQRHKPHDEQEKHQFQYTYHFYLPFFFVYVILTPALSCRIACRFFP